MNTKHRYILFIALTMGVFGTSSTFGQGVYFDPSPTDVSAPARLYVDITSSECSCPELSDVDPETNPLYIWTWNPPVENDNPRPPLGPDELDVNNGEWTSSNENLKMTQDPDNPNLWYYDFMGFSVVEFYNQPAGVFYATGIDFLVKEKNGAPADMAEQKSPDIGIILEPLGCFEKVCPFPETFFQDQYFFINYDNNKEEIAFLQNMGPDECLIWYRISINGGALTVFREETDKFKMTYDGDGLFSLSMIPEDYFELAEGDELTQIDVLITKAPINVPPFTQPLTLYPGCD